MSKVIQFKDSSGNLNPNDVYSTTETKIGTWIDGKPLYRKVVSFGALPNTTEKRVSNGVSNVDKIVSYKMIATNGTSFNEIPYVHANNLQYQINMYATRTEIAVATNMDRSNYTESYAFIEYTKTTD